MSDGTQTTIARPLSPLDEIVRKGARQLLQRALELEVGTGYDWYPARA